MHIHDLYKENCKGSKQNTQLTLSTSRLFKDESLTCIEHTQPEHQLLLQECPSFCFSGLITGDAQKVSCDTKTPTQKCSSSKKATKKCSSHQSGHNSLLGEERVLWVQWLTQFWRTSLRKRAQNYKFKFQYIMSICKIETVYTYHKHQKNPLKEQYVIT